MLYSKCWLYYRILDYGRWQAVGGNLKVTVISFLYRSFFSSSYDLPSKQSTLLVLIWAWKVGSIYWGKIAQGPVQMLPIWDNTLVLTCKKMSSWGVRQDTDERKDERTDGQTEGRTISKSYSRQAVTSLCETTRMVNISLPCMMCHREENSSDFSFHCKLLYTSWNSNSLNV